MSNLLNPTALMQMLQRQMAGTPPIPPGLGMGQADPTRPDTSTGMLAPQGAAPGGPGTAVGKGASTPEELPLNLRTGPSSNEMSSEDFLKSLPSPNAIPAMAAPRMPQEPDYPAPPQMEPMPGGVRGRLVAGLSGIAGQPNPFETQRRQRFQDALQNWQAQVAPMREKYQEQVQQAQLGPRLQTEQIQNEMMLRRMAMMSGGFGREAISALGQLSPQEQAILKSAMAEGDPKALAQAISHIDLQRNITGRNAMLARQTMGEIMARAGVTPEMDLAQSTQQLQAAVRAGTINPKEYQDVQAFSATQPFLPGARLSQAKVFAGPREELNRILQGGLNLRQGEEGIKIFDQATNASQRLARMAINAPKAVAGNQQAMVAMLMDHIGMTLGIQRGARITKDAISSAEQSRGLVSGTTAHLNFVKDPQTGEDVLNWQDPVRGGTVLTNQQISQMMDLGQEQHRVMWVSARTTAAQARAYNIPVNEPEDIMEGLAPGVALQAPPVFPVGGKGANLGPNLNPKKPATKPSLDDIFNPKPK